MNGSAVQARAMRIAASLPRATHEHPFGPDWDVFKVENRVFLLITDIAIGGPIAVMKCTPEDSLALRQEHSSITPGYHMNKRHWITLHGAPATTAGLVETLVCESYLLVRDQLPRNRRPPLDDHLHGLSQAR